MKHPSQHRIVVLVMSFLLVVLTAATTAGARSTDARERVVKKAVTERLTGPVVSLWVIDHGGADPALDDLVPYQQAFKKVLGGCWISPATLASAVFLMSDRATLGSGHEF